MISQDKGIYEDTQYCFQALENVMNSGISAAPLRMIFG
jgi:hypothetical protein